MSATFSGLVERAMTATNGSPSIAATCASLIAVDPLLASTIVVPGPMCPLQMP